MNLSDVQDLTKEDILARLGLATRLSTSQRAFGVVAAFGVGILVGAGAALMMTPKSGAGLREDLGQRIRSFREEVMNATRNVPSLAESDEAGA